MLKVILASLTLAFGLNAAAATEADISDMSQAIFMKQHELMAGSIGTEGLNWKVGDENDYSLDMGFIKGTMIMKVASIGADGIWMNQDMDLGFAGKQKVETLLDPNTGEIKKMIVNGKEQAPPKSDIEVIEMTEDNIKVPAGTFDCIHARIKDKENNQEINMWINPQLIPLSGMLKTVQPTQMGTATILLTKFRKN